MSISSRSWGFQSTPPARGATTLVVLVHNLSFISIHAPREGGDLGTVRIKFLQVSFQSTPPARGATQRNNALPQIP